VWAIWLFNEKFRWELIVDTEWTDINRVSFDLSSDFLWLSRHLVDKDQHVVSAI